MSLSPGRCCRTLCVLILLFLAVSFTAPAWAEWQDPVYILFPRIKTDSLSTTALAIANPTAEDAVVRLWLVGNNGQVVETSQNFIIPANTQLARQITELFPGRSQFDGFLWLGSTNISVVGFFLAYNSDLNNHQIDGAEAVVLGGLPRTVIFPELTTGTGAFTEINVLAFTDADLKVTLSLYRGTGGSPIQTKQITVPAGDLGGRFSGRVNEIFTVSIPSPGYVTATADPASGYGLIGYEHFGNDRVFAGRNAIAAPFMAREIPFSLFGSQLAEGYGYTSEITLINPTDQPANVKISAFRTGTPQMTGSPDPVAIKTTTIAAHGMIKQRARTLLGLPVGDFVGWLRVDSNIAGVVGDITFGDGISTPQRFLSSVQLHSSPVSDFVFSHVADGMGFTTGITFLNINPDPASVHMEVFDVDGNLTGSRNFTLEPYQHGPRVLSELIPGFQPQIGGFVHITSDIDIFAFELFLYAPSGQVLSLAAVPPQRGNGTMSGVLTPAVVDSAGLASTLKLMRAEPAQKYPASFAKGIRMDEQLEFMPGEMIVELRSSASPDALERLAERHAASIKVKSPNRVHLLRTNGVESVSLLRSGAGSPGLATAKRATLDAVEALNLEPDVVYAEPNYISHPDKVPNDSFYRYQWHYPYIKLPEAWDITTGSASTIVAVIDTGAKYGHPDLGPRLAGAGYDYDFITDPQVSLDGDGPDANADDPGDDPNQQNSSYHGSHVAGTIGAATNDGAGVAGVNWACRLMVLRGLGAGGGTDYDISQAILYAARLDNATGKKPTQSAKVINMSLSSDGASTTERNAVEKALNAGVIIVAAAGNKGNDVPRYPAAFPGVIAVGATDLSGELAAYSNYGSHVSVVAPGGNTAADLNDDQYVDGVLSCGWKQDTNAPSYPFYQGTSMASPHVAGIVSLMLAKNPNLTPAQVKQYLEETAIDLGDPGKDDRYGYGMVDPVAALNRVMGSTSGTPKLVVSTNTLDFGYTETELTVTVSNGGGGTLIVNQTSVTTSKGSGWLSVTSSPSVLTVKVNRGTLATGDYAGTVTVTSNGGNASIAVLMKVGTPTGPGNLGTIYILALDPRTLNTIGSLDSESFPDLLGDLNKDGKLEFQFPPIFAGYYFVVAGNDADNDHIICEDGEYCGLYPVSSQLSLVQILPNEDTGGVNFVLEKPTSPASASGVEELRLRTGTGGFPVIRNPLTSTAILKAFRQKLTGAAGK
jgi:serine protease